MTSQRTTTGATTETMDPARQAWSLGDYHRFATATVWQVGPRLVAACGIGPGQRVLDVAAGTGNAAIRAAEAGAAVTASDITPENFDAGRNAAKEADVELEWVEADAQALPFEDDRFDATLSVFGAIFAPDHEAVAGEMLRVTRPGGTIGMLNFTPEGLIADFFGALADYAPEPPPDASPPPLWGSENHVRELFGDRVAALEMSRDTYVERVESPEAYRDLFLETFGPIVAIDQSLADDPGRREAFRSDLLAFAREANSGPEGGPAAYEFEYLRVVAAKRSP